MAQKTERVRMEAGNCDALLIQRLARRASELAAGAGIDYPILDACMDLTATHLNGCALDLPGLLAANDGDFGHDVLGIRRHLNRQTGQLEGFFVPRLARRYGDAHTV